MANLKRRPDSDLNHENWDQEDPHEEQGEFQKANEEDLRGRRILKPRRKTNPGGAAGQNNPFSGFAFGSAPSSGTSSGVMPSFSFGIPATSSNTAGLGIGISSAEAGSTGSLFKLAGITPCSEPPTKASADSSTADGPGGSEIPLAQKTGDKSAEDNEIEVGSISEGEGGGVTEESSNSSSLPWNISSRQLDNEASEEGKGGADSMQSENLPRIDLHHDSWADNGNVLAQAEAMPTEKSVPTSTAPADSSESSLSSLNPIPTSATTKNPFTSFTFGNSFGNSGSGSGSGSAARVSLFQPFASASAAVSQSQRDNALAAVAASSASDVASSSTSAVTPIQTQQQNNTVSGLSGGDPLSPESSGIHLVRSSIEEDSADYENDTTSSSNKLIFSENEASVDGVGGPDDDREVEADSNEEREAEGVDS